MQSAIGIVLFVKRKHVIYTYRLPYIDMSSVPYKGPEKLQKFYLWGKRLRVMGKRVILVASYTFILFKISV